MEKNPAYWRKGYPKCERLVFSFGIPPHKILSEFRAGRFSLAADLYPSGVEALRREAEYSGGYRETPRLSTYHLVFNCHRRPLEDRNLRRKLVGAVDRMRIVRQTLGTLALPAQELIPPGLLGHDPMRSIPEGELVHGAVTGSELELNIGMHPVYTQEYSVFTQEAVRALNAVGVKLRVKTGTAPEFVETCSRG